MSKKQQIKVESPKQTFVQGKTYLLKSDIWAIDFASNKDFMLVFAREQQFKVKPEDLILLDHGGEENE